jgi:hypothetical protein
MADVFVSYAAEQGEVARYVAQGLETAGYDVWYYQKHGQIPGEDYWKNIGRRVREARAVVLFVSDAALQSVQCKAESRIACETEKELIPLLSGFSHAELLEREFVPGEKEGQSWADKIGSRVAIQIDGMDPEEVLQTVLVGLRANVRPSRELAGSASSGRAPSPAPATRPAGTPSSGAVIAGAVGALGLLYCLFSMGRVFSPAPGGEAWLAANFPTVRVANILVNLLGLAQNAGLLYGAWRLKQNDPAGAPLIRKVALSMLVAVGLWAVVCLLTFTGSRAAALMPNPAARSTVVNGTLFLAMVALLPSGIVFWLFRNAKR